MWKPQYKEKDNPLFKSQLPGYHWHHSGNWEQVWLSFDNAELCGITYVYKSWHSLSRACPQWVIRFWLNNFELYFLVLTFVFCFICFRRHWTLAVICPREFRIFWFDSLKGGSIDQDHKKVFEKLVLYLPITFDVITLP